MREPWIVMGLVVAALAALPSVAAAEGDCRTYGEGVALEAATPVGDILAAPEAWAGKTVRVEGEVREVCAMAGCWMTLAAEGSEGSAAALRVKVEDGVIVFPVSARGQRGVAEGEVAVHDMSREDYVAWQRHLAEEKGQAYDEAAAGDGPYLSVEVQATGAEVCAP